MDAVETVVEDKRPARHDGAGSGGRKAAGLEIMIVKADEHVLALHAPIWGECPFELPPPAVHVVAVSLPEVEMSQLPHPVATH